MNLKINNGKQPKPRRCLAYGPHGVGKTTWAAQAPNHLILNFEDGVGDINCRSTDRITTWGEICTILEQLMHEPDDLDWIVIDTLDWLEQIIHAQVASEAGKGSISEIAYGKGFQAAIAKWQYLIRGFEYLRRTRDCGIILLAHGETKRFESPESDSYDRYQPALHATASNLFQEYSDEVLFCGFKILTRKEDMGFNRTREVAFGSAERYIRTTEGPAMLAKSRLEIAEEIPFSWSVYQDAINKNLEGEKEGEKS